MTLDNSVASVITIVRGLIKDQALKRVPGDPFQYDNDNKFTLSQDFVSEPSIIVYLNNVVLSSSDYSYDSETNRVCIDIVSSGLSLNKGDTILITYDYFKKYSDTELEGYISSSLSYFVENRYKKVFCISDNDEIIAINDLIPTIKELYFIAIIASILTDPMNVDIRTPDFSVSAQRHKSDREQITEAFTRYQRFVGDARPIFDCDTYRYKY